MSELLEALYRGDGDRVAELLAAGGELDVFEAAAVGQTERLRKLLDDDPDLAATWTDDGFTPLHLAAFSGIRTQPAFWSSEEPPSTSSPETRRSRSLRCRAR